MTSFRFLGFFFPKFRFLCFRVRVRITVRVEVKVSGRRLNTFSVKHSGQVSVQLDSENGCKSYFCQYKATVYLICTRLDDFSYL